MTAQINNENYEQFLTQSRLLKPVESRDSLIKAISEPSFQEALKKAPASTRLDLVCAYEGGLLEHSLRVLSYMCKLRTVYDLKQEVSTASLIITGLYHDIGKVFYYTPNDSEWHRNKLGQMYNVESGLKHLSVSQLSIGWLAEQAGIVPDIHCWYAIANVDKRQTDAYGLKQQPTLGREPPVALLLRQAVEMACWYSQNNKPQQTVQNIE